MKEIKKYRWYHLGISGGKDSDATLLWVVKESGWDLGKLKVSFCDTGNEHGWTYRHIEMLREKVWPIETLKPEYGFYELAAKRGRFPSPKARFCTQVLKMQATQRYVKTLMGDGDVLLLTGVRAAESPARAKLEESEFDFFYGCDVYRPILNWKIDDVWKIHEKYGIERNPLYDAGARRVGCFPCIMSRKSEIRVIAERFPERINKIRAWEEEIGSSFYPRTYVPAAFRSREVVTKDGERVMVPTIDDVVDWSMTERGGKAYSLFKDEPLACNSSLGHCE